jgi:hypothetical protein
MREGLKTHIDALANEDLKQDVIDITKAGLSEAEKIERLKRISESDDPLSHAILVQSAVEAGTLRDREIAEEAILERAQRLALNRSVAQVKFWLKGVKGEQKPPGYAAVLKSLDTTLPAETHTASFKEAYPNNQRLVLRLVAAYALDTGKLDEYRTLLGQMIADSSFSKDFERYSVLSQILASGELSLVFGEDAIQMIDKMPDSDLIWLLKILAERNDNYVRSIANLAADRKVLSTLRSKFIAIVLNRSNLPQEILLGLIKASSGAMTKEQLGDFGKWYDPESEKVLLYLLADEYPAELQGEIIELLAAKSLTKPLAQSLIQWVRNKRWNTKTKYARAIGVLANLDLFQVQEIEEAIAVFADSLRDPAVLDTLLEVGDDRINEILLKNYPQALDATILIRLLGISEGETKKLVIYQLAKENNIAILKIIIDLYERESDPEVKKLYEEQFWVIRERVSTQGRQ